MYQYPREKRKRRSVEEARVLILDAAEKRLAAEGPAGLRLQEIAADAGISHSTILHHFGSREALVEAVVRRALDSIQRDVASAFGDATFEADDAARLLSDIGRLLRRGHARMIAWLALEGRRQVDSGRFLRVMAEVMHARRVGEHGAGAQPEDTLFVVVLAGFVTLAEGILGPLAWESAGLSGDAHAPERFYQWFSALLNEHLHLARAKTKTRTGTKARTKTKTRTK